MAARRPGGRRADRDLSFYHHLSRAEPMTRPEEFKAYLRPVTRDGDLWLHEIVAFP